jgi:essential nuclear protein 1
VHPHSPRRFSRTSDATTHQRPSSLALGAVQLFMAPEAPARMTLADIVMGKIKEKETEIASQLSAFGGPADDEPQSSLDPKVVKVFTTVGSILATYRSGKLPKV